jgi:hypothetical protein
MPTNEHGDNGLVDLRVAAPMAGYSPESLRKLMWRDDPPPLVKRAGRWMANPDRLRRWARARAVK